MTSLSERAKSKYSRFLEDLGSTPDAPTDEVLRSFCITCAQIDLLNEQIEREGLLVETPKGMKENPAVNTKHKLEADKARGATYLKRVFGGGSDGPSIADDWS